VNPGFSLIVTDTSPLITLALAGSLDALLRLRELEAAGLIQSTDCILDRAAERGRNVERQRQAGADATTHLRLRRQLQEREDRK